jgi:hypothetical protein
MALSKPLIGGIVACVVVLVIIVIVVVVRKVKSAAVAAPAATVPLVPQKLTKNIRFTKEVPNGWALFDIAELEIIGDDAKPLLASDITITTSWDQAGSVKAMDGDKNTFWASLSTPLQWINFELKTPKHVTKIVVNTRQDGYFHQSTDTKMVVLSDKDEVLLQKVMVAGPAAQVFSL